MTILYKENGKTIPLKAYEEKDTEKLEKDDLLTFIFTIIKHCISILGLTKEDMPNVATCGLGMGQIGLSLTPGEMKTLSRNLIIIDLEKIFSLGNKIESQILLVGTLAHEVCHFWQKKSKGISEKYAKGNDADASPDEIEADAFGIWFICKNCKKIKEEQAAEILCEKLSIVWYNERIRLAKTGPWASTENTIKNVETGDEKEDEKKACSSDVTPKIRPTLFNRIITFFKK